MPAPVTFSHDIFSSQVVGGISRYFTELALALHQDGWPVQIAAGDHRNLHLRDLQALPTTAGLATGRYTAQSRLPTQLLRLRNELWAATRTPAGGIFHRTYYPLIDLMGGRRPLVTTVHDMVWEMYPDEARSFPINSKLKRKAVDRADLVIVPTEATRVDLCELWDIHPGKVHVVHHGFAPLTGPASGHGPVTLEGRPYVLFVGRRGGYKNFANFLRGYAASRLPAEGVALLCFGGGGFGPEDRALIAECGMDGHVHWAGGDDTALFRAYRDALLFIYPSRCEGFGLPVLEAMGAGCPVALAVEAAALVEVAGGAALTYDAENIEVTASMLSAMVADDVGRGALIEKGRRRVAEFTWQRCARETGALYAQLA